MYIKYDESDLLDFFEKEPIEVGDYDGGDWIYRYIDDNFKLVMFISTYEMYINITITFKENIVYTQKFRNVSEIIQLKDKTIRIMLNNGQTIILKKYPQIGVLVE
jgi:hypothetical protein